MNITTAKPIEHPASSKAVGWTAVLLAWVCGSMLACSSATPIAEDQTHQPSPPETPREIYPGVILDRVNRHVDVQATVVGREVDWLELLACRPGIRDYESIVAVDAEATQLQTALILLGLEPGQPARAEKDANGELQFFAPHGPELELFFVLEDQPDQPIPANQWVIDQENGQVMPGNRWVFTGSTIIEFKGQNHFMAETNGTVVSLLNFGDELVSRPTTDSQDGGTELWTANTPVIPAVGTKLKLRFQPAE
ncbi:YdjY domain-containing protein [Algisphaera agarilytica]|uniref:Uncharacterized protein n=1 Tax=Algisphaera agarilytica TaxID=1385975 RepID=A0A7X0H6X9_9BACT|nr:YdjY domain-containing protein [Algisphaera agarilytica]MBB6430392.1 hypothetical protein [Algisphaera agarilytica]